MAEKISVGKKKKIIAGAIAGAVVLAGAGAGLGIALSGGNSDPVAPEHRVEFVLGDDTGIDTVYDVNGNPIKVETLQVGDVIQFPKPAQTFINQGDAKEYFVGWAANRESTLPTFFVGEETIEITEDVTTLHAIYMTASEELVYTDIDAETCTVAYSDVAIDEARGGILVIPNEHNGKRVVAVNAGKIVADALVVIDAQNAIIAEQTSIKNASSDQAVKDAATAAINAAKAEITAQQTIINEALAAMQNKGSIKKVVVARGINAVERYAFYNCNEMTNLSFVDDSFIITSSNSGQAITIAEENVISEIGAYAFQKCAKLTNITIPADVNVIERETFQGCSALSSVKFESTENLVRIGYMAFEKTALKEVDLSKQENLTIIAAKAFQDCTELETFKMPNTVTNLGEMAFINAVKLTDINLSTAIIGSVGDGDGAVVNNGQLVRVFENCDSLESIHIPAGVTVLATKLFNGCDNLKNVTFDYIAAITEIHNYAFQNCKALEGFDGSFSNVTYMGVATFQGCESLKSFVLPATIRGALTENQHWNPQANTLPARTFTGCTNLSSIVIPETIKNIGEFAFAFSGVRNVIIPASVTNIQYRAFHAMPRVQTFTFNCVKFSSDGGDTFQPYYRSEPFVDTNGNKKWDEGEEFTDLDENGAYTEQSPIDSALKKITFGADVQQIKFKSTGVWYNAVAGHNFLETIEFKSATPPTVTNLPKFASVTKVIVPKGSLDAYKAALPDYADLMVEA